ncbi:hypothetical protein F511_35608 [Dorcoceras hygrometricum]|uniref:Uncharacterized protein n=1 Tax=Dorcoceras hygrometricum TaxID=472368 RepID=A0A2Z7C229_9LAMI|nr:hypothetical protein F511_35608 [Dorcoceras hygrometricum]
MHEGRQENRESRDRENSSTVKIYHSRLRCDSSNLIAQQPPPAIKSVNRRNPNLTYSVGNHNSVKALDPQEPQSKLTGEKASSLQTLALVHQLGATNTGKKLERAMDLQNIYRNQHRFTFKHLTA